MIAWLLAVALAAPPGISAQLRPEPVPWTAPRAPSADLAAVAEDTLRALREMGSADPDIVGTLEFVVRVAREDSASGADRLADPAFLAQCLAGWRWVPDVKRAGEQIRLTRYLVYEVEGRAAAEGAWQHALWGLPDDDALRFKYTRQDVAAGVYREGGEADGRAPALVWLTHPDHEQALLQGSVSVRVPGEPTDRLYNVHRNNGIAYDRSISDTRLQRRYWYFRGIDAVRGWAAEPVAGPALRANVAVAGDLKAFGFGRVFAVQAADGMRIVVLADTGGAFEGNLHQLDLYTGVFPSRAAFDRQTSGVGETAGAWVGVAEGCR